MERHEEMLSPEEQYAQLAPTLDADGFSLKWIRPHRSIARFIRRSARVRQRTSKSVLGRRDRM